MIKSISLKAQQALDQYLALLANLGADESNLLRRRTFVITLLRDLEKIPHDAKVYGTLVDEKLSLFTQAELKRFYQATAREFWWFWSEDDVHIDAMYRGELISVNPFTINIDISLEDLHEQAASFYRAQPDVRITGYRQKLGNKPDLTVRVQWAQTLLFIFKEFEQADYTYRAAVDALLSIIDSRTMKQSFLVVARDFYIVWNALSDKENLSS